MTSEVRDWLPREAFAANLVTAALSGVIDEWASVWFSDAGALRIEVEGADGVLSSPSGAAIDGQAVTASFDGYGKRLVLEMALGLRFDRPSLNETDHKLLDSFAIRLFRDLVERLDRHMEATVTNGSASHMATVVLSGAGGDLAHLRVSQPALIPLIKACIGVSKHALEPVPYQQALAATPVVLEAVLGKATLAMGELKGLAPGDVLVLDRAVDGPIDLRIMETGQIVVAGRLQRNDGRVAVHI